jgi:pyrimidine operon attenuation protein/uracil phosphoribosyltransferase
VKNNIENHYSIELNVERNPYELDIDDFFKMATRCNPKRRFLFVSKVLGKHLSVNPKRALDVSRLLAMHYYESRFSKFAFDRENLINRVRQNEHEGIIDRSRGYEIDEDTLVIGFAETATGLSHGVFDAFENVKGFYHTTRENLRHSGNTICFEEEHSHATAHKIYENENLKLDGINRVILVDDEISTGNTILNIMKSINETFHIKNFDILSLLDWRKKEYRDKFDLFSRENELNVSVYSLIDGYFDNIENGEINLDEIKKHEIFDELKLNREFEKTNEKNKCVFVESLSKEKDDELLDLGSKYMRYTGRFGLNRNTHKRGKKIMYDISKNIQPYVSGKTLILGTEEFIYVPMCIADKLDGEVYFKSTTRSPIYPYEGGDYPIENGIAHYSLYNEGVVNYVYNIEKEEYNTILIMTEGEGLSKANNYLYNCLKKYCDNVRMFYFSCNKNNLKSDPPQMGSYDEKDIVFLLKNLGNRIEEKDNKTREKAIQSGVHYSEMLPIEYKPSKIYLDLFHDSLRKFKSKLALAVGITAEKILKARGEDVVLVSLARAGSPAGVLVKRYMEQVRGINWPHYSISIIRGRGIDKNAMEYIFQRHPNSQIQFLDGWTGKGSITKELKEALSEIDKIYGKRENLSDELAVLADPGACTAIYGTREDFLIPNACLNSTISGLLSRTVYREDMIDKNDYHGVKFYRELKNEDLSNYYIEEIEREFESIKVEAENEVKEFDVDLENVNWIGQKDVKRIEKDFEIESIHFIKPGIGETTRVLLRRIPWKILVREDAKNIEHVIQLAREKNIPIETYPLEAYQCCGIVKALKGE